MKDIQCGCMCIPPYSNSCWESLLLDMTKYRNSDLSANTTTQFSWGLQGNNAPNPVEFIQIFQQRNLRRIQQQSNKEKLEGFMVMICTIYTQDEHSAGFCNKRSFFIHFSNNKKTQNGAELSQAQFSLGQLPNL